MCLTLFSTFKNTTVFYNLKYVKSVLMDTLNETKSPSYYLFGKPCEGRQEQVIIHKTSNLNMY